MVNGICIDSTQYESSKVLINIYPKNENGSVNRAMHPNIISIVKPTRCTNVSNLFYFGITLYMFHTVFPSIIRSSRLYIQQQACFLFHLASKIILKNHPKMAIYTPQILKIQHRTLS